MTDSLTVSLFDASVCNDMQNAEYRMLNQTNFLSPLPNGL
jgi:hypothetical protein